MIGCYHNPFRRRFISSSAIPHHADHDSDARTKEKGMGKERTVLQLSSPPLCIEANSALNRISCGGSA